MSCVINNGIYILPSLTYMCPVHSTFIVPGKGNSILRIVIVKKLKLKRLLLKVYYNSH
ncbi:hypothetical protein X975_24384, partial [Stegodyphus mimosarum]